MMEFSGGNVSMNADSCLWSGPADLGEGPLWDHRSQCFYWVDCLAGRLYVAYDFDEVKAHTLPAGIGCVALCASGGLVALMGDAFWHIDPDTGYCEPISSSLFLPTAGYRVNDGKCDRQGRFWAGTVAGDFDQPDAHLYCLDASGNVNVMLSDISISNGIGWSPDNRYMYYCDSGPGRAHIQRFAFDADTGDISSPTLFYQHENADATPDGLTVDSAGNIWTAIWNGGEVVQLSPEGDVLQRIVMPVKRPTSCMLGGPDLKTLFVTSCSKDVGESGRLPSPNGGVFAYRVDTPGLMETPWAGVLPTHE